MNATVNQRTAREKILTDIATILVAISSTGTPSGEVYALNCGAMTLEHYQQTLGLIKVSGLVIESSHFLTLTEKGLKLRADIESITLGKVVAS